MAQSVNNQGESLDQQIDNFQKIPEPNIKDLSVLLITFLKNMSELNKKLNDFENRITTMENNTDLHINRMNNIEEEMRDKEEINDERFDKVDDKVELLTATVNESTELVETSATQTLQMQQSQIDNDVILKGFPVKPNVSEVLDNFKNLFNISDDQVRDSFYVSYTKSSTVNLQGSTNGIIHFVVISFKTKSTKIQLFDNIKNHHGPILLHELSKSLENHENLLIKCANRLTKFNLQAQGVLYKALRRNKISEYRYHNLMFQVKFTTISNWLRIDSQKKIAHLHGQISATT